MVVTVGSYQKCIKIIGGVRDHILLPLSYMKERRSQAPYALKESSLLTREKRLLNEKAKALKT